MSSRSMSPREWTSLYEVTKRDLQRKFIEGIPLVPEEVQSFERIITSLETQLKIFAAYPIEYDISASEIGRRGIIVKGLTIVLDSVRRASPDGIDSGTLPASFPSTSPNGKADSTVIEKNKSFLLFGSSSNNAHNYTSVSSQSTSSSIGTTSSAVSSSTQRQQDILKVQDEMVLDISAGVGRLHNQARTIGDETKMHIRLLDGIDEDVESATTTLRVESRHTENVKKWALNVSWMYKCIAMEVIVIVILIVLVASIPR